MLAALGGFIGWLIVEPFDWLTPPGDVALTLGAQLTLGAIIGLFVGAGVGVATALSGISPRDALKTMLLGLVVGALGGAIGMKFGNAAYQPLYNLAQSTKETPTSLPSFGGFIFELIGRSIGWAIMGALIGLGPGLATESPKKMVNGLIGGLIGGAVGGFAFQILNVFTVPGAMLRMIGFVITGGAIGMFIGFIEELTKRAWLVHLKGRNEGKEFQIFKRETVVGRNELIDIPIFGDPDIEPRHFIITADETRHVLRDCGTASGTMVNSQKVQQHTLRDGDIIQVGMTKFLFRDKATRSATPRPISYTGGPAIPDNPNICPFCGSIKDASGNCACTVGGVQRPAPASNPTQQSTVMQPPSDPFGSITKQQTAMGMSPFGAPQMGQGGRLVATSGPYAGQSFDLNAGEVTIGRQSDRTISLSTDNTVSRQHARIANEAGQFVLYDMGSANGTHLNGSRITQQVLTNGDVVQVGSTKFRVEL